MEYEIDDCDALFDPSTNPSLVYRPKAAAGRKPRLYSWNRARPCQMAVLIPEEEERPA
jgi:hypothetical protein